MVEDFFVLQKRLRVLGVKNTEGFNYTKKVPPIKSKQYL